MIRASGPATRSHDARNTRTSRLVLAAAAVAFVVAALGACSAPTATSERRAQVAERGEQVMPFALDATTHTFTKTASGGVQSVTADDPADRRQVELIRQHLREEQEKFSRGDFEDPARIHGMDMPGVSALAAGAASIVVTYADAPDGAVLTYTTSDPALVDALHGWFDRQVMDHGDHAKGG